MVFCLWGRNVRSISIARNMVNYGVGKSDNKKQSWTRHNGLVIMFPILRLSSKNTKKNYPASWNVF
jgi:hypothetical protein